MLAALLGLTVAVLAAAWTSQPPRAGGAGMVPTPTAVVLPDEGVERDLCGYVRSAGEAVDLAYVREVARDPRIRFTLAMAASSYVEAGGTAGAREQLLVSCMRAGHG